MTYEPGQVICRPFPFTNHETNKNRPVLVLSFNRASGHLVLAMITSAQNSPWLVRLPNQRPHQRGFARALVVRARLFTLDVRLLRGTLGYPADADRTQLGQRLSQLLDLTL